MVFTSKINVTCPIDSPDHVLRDPVRVRRETRVSTVKSVLLTGEFEAVLIADDDKPSSRFNLTQHISTGEAILFPSLTVSKYSVRLKYCAIRQFDVGATPKRDREAR